MSRYSTYSLRLKVVGSMIAAGIIALPSAQDTSPLSLDRLTLKGLVAGNARHQDRQAIRLIESDKSRNTLGLAIVNGITFRDGTIDVEVAGRRGPMRFRTIVASSALRSGTPAADRFEYIYLRPDNRRAEDQIRRNHSTQYASHPDFRMAALAKEVPRKVRVVRRSRVGCLDPISNCGQRGHCALARA